jgi:hypothetical protein
MSWRQIWSDYAIFALFFLQKKYLSVKIRLSAIHKFDKWTGQEQQFFPTLTFEKVTGGLCYKI